VEADRRRRAVEEADEPLLGLPPDLAEHLGRPVGGVLVGGAEEFHERLDRERPHLLQRRGGVAPLDPLVAGLQMTRASATMPTRRSRQ
jgi:hypothetical protein